MAQALGMAVGMIAGRSGENPLDHPHVRPAAPTTVRALGMTGGAIPVPSPVENGGIGLDKPVSDVVPVIPSPYGDDDLKRDTTTSTTMGTA